MKTGSSERTSQTRAIGWLMDRACAQWPWVAASLAAGFAGGLLAIAQAWLLSRLAAAVFIEGRPLSRLALPLALFAGCAALRSAAAWAREVSGFAAGAAVRKAVRRELLERLSRLGPMFAARTPAGGIASALVEPVAALQPFYARYLPQLALAVLTPGAILAVVFPLSWAAGVLLLVGAPLIPLFMALVGMGAETVSQRHFGALTRMSGQFLDLLQGLATLKLFGQSRAATDRVRQTAAGYRRSTMAVLKVAFLSAAVLEFFTSMAIALVAVYLGMSYLGYLDFGLYGERLGFADGFFMLLLAPEFFLPLRELGQHYHARAEATGAAQELIQVFSRNGAPPEAVVGAPPPAVPDIRLEAVDFSYGGARQGALSGVTLDIPYGRRTVVMGESGAGKSSLIHLLMGFITPERGRVVVGGMPLTALDLAAWRRKVAWIGQHPVMFYGTIADNIRLGRPQAGPGDIAAAAERAGVMDFIRCLPRGLDTVIGEQGAGLSKGQAQRVALARVFVRDPAVLLLDEPLASLDMETGRRVGAALAAFARGRTLVMMTHRLDAIDWADQVVVMAAGSVAFRGSPSQFRAYRSPGRTQPVVMEAP